MDQDLAAAARTIHFLHRPLEQLHSEAWEQYTRCELWTGAVMRSKQACVWA